MKILYVTLRPPYPPFKGDQLIAYNQIRQLSQMGYKVNLITFISNEDEESELKKNFDSYCNSIYCFKLNKLKILLNSLYMIINYKPIQVNMFYFAKIKKQVEKICFELNPDIIHIQTIRSAEYFKNIDKPKTIDLIDALSLNMKRRANNENILVRWIFRLESKLLYNYEKRVIDLYDKVILVSENDKLYLNDSDIEVNPNGTYINKDLLQKYAKIQKEKIIIFHGNMGYFPNVDAILTFVRDIWPVIVKRYPEYKFYIVGKDPIEKIRKLNGINNITVTGFVPDICEYLIKASIGVYPLNSGTGMQNKILEALACGLPSVATPLAIQGIKGITSNELYIANNKEEIINGLIQLIENEDLRIKYSKTGQSFIFKNYSWEKNALNLVRIWQEAIINRSR